MRGAARGYGRVGTVGSQLVGAGVAADDGVHRLRVHVGARTGCRSGVPPGRGTGECRRSHREQAEPGRRSTTGGLSPGVSRPRRAPRRGGAGAASDRGGANALLAPPVLRQVAGRVRVRLDARTACRPDRAPRALGRDGVRRERDVVPHGLHAGGRGPRLRSGLSPARRQARRRRGGARGGAGRSRGGKPDRLSRGDLARRVPEDDSRSEAERDETSIGTSWSLPTRTCVTLWIAASPTTAAIPSCSGSWRGSTTGFLM